MKKKLLSLLLCAVMVVGTTPLSPLADYVVMEASAVNIEQLQTLFNSVPDPSTWEDTYKDSGELTTAYEFAISILENPEAFSQERIDICTERLQGALDGLEYRTKGITLNKTAHTASVGQSFTLRAILEPTNAADPVEWKSSNSAVASVNQNGVVTVNKYSANNVTISATSNGFTASCVLTVLNPLGGVKLSKNSAELYEGRSLKLTASAYGKDAESLPTGDVFYTWSSDNEKVASVTDTGAVTAVSPGTCTVTVTATDNTNVFTAKCNITVYEMVSVSSLQPITITTSGSLVVTAGETTTFRVTVLPSNASIKDLSWKSADTSIASITGSDCSSSGIASAKIKAHKEGKVKITYTTTDGSKISGSFTLDVRPLISSVALSPVSKVISLDSVGEKFTVTIKPENAGNQVLSWSSDNPDVCEVDYKGTLTPHKTGTCTISAATCDGSNIVVSAKLRVADKAASVVISKSSLSLEAGDKYTLSATVTTLDGIDYGDVKWTSSDTTVATVDQNGVVTAKYPGSTVIKATALDGSGKNAVCILTVTKKVEGVSITESKTVYVGKSFTLTPVFTPSYATNKNVTWSSADSTIASVDSTGKVTGKKEGTTTITVKTVDGGFTANCTVKVMIQTTGVTLNRTEAKINKGDTFLLIPTVLPSNATNKEVTWKSSDTKVATVASNGVVTAVAGGTCTITCTTKNSSKTATCEITVIESVSGVTVKNERLSLYKGQVYTLTATVLPSTATNKAVTWKSSDTSVVRVSSAGVLTAVGIGTASITVKTVDGGYEAYCDVTVVKKVPVTGIKLDATEKYINVDEYYTFLATISPSNASEKGITWTTSNKKIVTVNTSGRIKGVAPGTAIITATTVDGGYQMQCKVTVIQPVTGVRINASSVTMAAGKSKTLVANVFPTNATNKKVNWSTSDKTIATVNSKGVVTALKAGSVTITATTVDGGFTSTCNFTIYVPVTGVKISATSVALPKGETRLLTASVLPKNATNQGITWKSSNTSIATVNEAGQITARSRGTVNITATSKEGGYSATCVVTVLQLAESVQLNYSSVTMDVGKTKTLSASLTPSTVTYKTVKFKSSNTKVATVTSKGVITAVKAGTAIITCTSKDGNAKTTCKVTVTQPATGITLSPKTMSVREGKLKAITATVKPVDVTNAKVLWKSSNTKIATVDSSGVVKGIKKGTVTITATTASAGKTATCKVTVIKSVTGITLNKTQLTINVGSKSVITPNIKPAAASIKTVKWTSSNYDVADVTKDGQVIAKAPGYATITAKTDDGGYKAKCDVLVVQPVKGVSISKTSLLVEAGEKFTLKATVKPSNASNKNVKWSSSNTKVAKVSSTGVVTGLKSGTATITVKTVNGGYTAKCTVRVVKKVTGITLNKTEAKLYLDGKITLKATVTPTDATVKNVTWKSSNIKVAKVTSKGVVSPVAPGKATITCTTEDGGFKASCVVTVKRAITKITLNKSSLTVNAGKTATLTANILPTNATDKTLKWATSDKNIATVSSKGVVTGVARGTATITATTENGLKASCKVTVKQPVTGVDISMNIGTVYAGEKISLSATVFPSNANNKAVTWSSANTAVAKVTTEGVVTGVKAGVTTVTVKTVDGSFTASCEVTVLQHVTSIAFAESAISIRKGDETDLVVNVYPANATDKTYTFESSDPDTVFVTATGHIIAVMGGEATVTVKSNENNKTAQCRITVIEPVTAVALDKEEETMFVGDNFTLGVVVSPTDANNKTVKWTSSDPAVATVSSTGVVTAMKSGEAVITVTTNDGGYTDNCKVICLQRPELIELSDTAVTVNTGATRTLTAAVLPEDTYDKTITWSSDNENIATVEDGVIKGINPGTAIITVTATENGTTASCEVTVHQPTQKVELDKAEVTVNNGETATLKATVYPSNASNRNVTWSTSDETVATVLDGVVTARGKGTAYISVKTEDGDLTAVCKVTVRQLPESVVFEKEEYTVATKETTNLVWSVLPENANDKSVAFESSDTQIAVVDADGVVTGVKAGEAVITATATDGRVKGETKITVVQKAESITVSGDKTVLWVSENADFTAEVLPEDTTDKSVRWSSSDETVATVDENGRITALKAGTCDIIATAENSVSGRITVEVRQHVMGIKFDRTEKAMKVGEEFTISATVVPESAFDKSVQWTSSDEAVATVDENGKVTALTLGNTVITATTVDGGMKTRCAVRVIKLVDSINFTENSIIIEKGKTHTLVPVILPEDATEKELTWTSSDETVLSVDENGVVTGLKGGKATVRAITTTDGVYAECEVTVDVKSTAITLNKTQEIIYCGDTLNLSAQFTPEDTTNKNIIWTSSDENIATVTDGVVTAIEKGEVTITAEAEDTGVKAECALTVYKHVASVDIVASELTLEKGSSANLSVLVKPDDATNKTLVWESDNSSVVSVEDGKVTALAVGTAKVTAKSEDGEITDICTVTVIRKPDAIELSEDSISIVEGADTQLSVTFLPDDVTEKEIEWFSSDENIAVVDENGKVTAVSKGEAEITAKSKAKEDVFAKCAVTVTRAVKAISIETKRITAYAGRNFTLEVAFTPADATNQNLTWDTSDKSVATVENGVVTAHNEGTAIITAHSVDGGHIAYCIVSVEIGIDSVSFDKTDVMLDKNGSVTIGATVLPENATDKTLIWESSDESVAVVENGVVTATSKSGVAVIKATAPDNKDAFAECTVTVKEPVTSVDLDELELELRQGSTATLNAIVTPSTATIKDLEWKSTDEKVVTVDDKGNLTAMGVGTANVICTSVDSGKYAICSVKVLRELDSLEVLLPATSMKNGATLALTVRANPENHDEKFSFASSNEDVFTVDEKGIVTAKGPGTATATVISSVSGTRATCSITVIQSVESLSFGVGQTTEAYTGLSHKLSYSVYPENASDKTVRWLTSDETVATVTESGLITYHSAGEVTITVQSVESEVYAQCTVTVKQAPEEIYLNTGETSIRLGSSLTLEAVIGPDNSFDKSVTWSSDNEGVAKVDQNGKVTAVGKGTAVITARTFNGLESTCIVNVT